VWEYDRNLLGSDAAPCIASYKYELLSILGLLDMRRFVRPRSEQQDAAAAAAAAGKAPGAPVGRAGGSPEGGAGAPGAGRRRGGGGPMNVSQKLSKFGISALFDEPKQPAAGGLVCVVGITMPQWTALGMGCKLLWRAVQAVWARVSV
jgi:hypothetical protein